MSGSCSSAPTHAPTFADGLGHNTPYNKVSLRSSRKRRPTSQDTVDVLAPSAYYLHTFSFVRNLKTCSERRALCLVSSCEWLDTCRVRTVIFAAAS